MKLIFWNELLRTTMTNFKLTWLTKNYRLTILLQWLKCSWNLSLKMNCRVQSWQMWRCLLTKNHRLIFWLQWSKYSWKKFSKINCCVSFLDFFNVKSSFQNVWSEIHKSACFLLKINLIVDLKSLSIFNDMKYNVMRNWWKRISWKRWFEKKIEQNSHICLIKWLENLSFLWNFL